MSPWGRRRRAHTSDPSTSRPTLDAPRSRRPALVLALLAAAALASSPALAANCSKGKPCGDTCINVAYTCHAGGSSPSTALSATAAPTTAQPGDLPDAALTPGDVLTGDVARICVPGYTKTVRDVPASLKKAVYHEYGILHHAPYSYEVDHLISLELGGSNSVLNLWPESYSGRLNARVKDRLENELHALVCSGRLDLATAQHAVATDWIAAYQHYLGPLP